MLHSNQRHRRLFAMLRVYFLKRLAVQENTSDTGRQVGTPAMSEGLQRHQNRPGRESDHNILHLALKLIQMAAMICWATSRISHRNIRRSLCQ